MEWFPILIIILNYVLIVILLINLKNLMPKKIIIDNGAHYRYIVIYGIYQKIFQKIPGINIF